MAKNPDEVKTEAQAALTEINQLVASAKTAATASTEAQAQVVAILNDAKAKLEEIGTAATEAVAAKTKVADLQTVVATKSQHIEDAQVHADKVRGELDRKLTEATQQATEAEASKTRAQSASDAATTVLTEIRTTKGSADTDADAVAKARKTAEDSAEIAKGLADKSATIEARIAEYEKSLEEFKQTAADRLKTIETLLPGATGAGLAHSLDKRRQSFLNPQKRWQWIFVGSVLAIVFVAVNGWWQIAKIESAPSSKETSQLEQASQSNDPHQFQQLFRLWLARLPVGAALLWLAVHAAREAALAKRIEEDYGYKSTVAASFEGFRRQMADLDANLKSDSPLAKLCGDTLATLAMLPGRIYDKHKLTVSPMDELRESAKVITEGAKPIAEVAKTLKVPGA
jgi:hypothetical protein